MENVSPQDVGMNHKKLLELDSIVKAQYSDIRGIVVLRKDYIAFEKYYNGFQPLDTLHVASVTKSIISALIGIAIDKGYIKSVDEKVLDFFPEYAFNPADIQKQAITIHHLLTMTAPYPFKAWHEPFARLCRQSDWIKYTLDGLGHGGKIGDFKYSSEGAHLLSAIITRSTGKCAREFANEYLFKPIGMREIQDHEMKGFKVDDLFGNDLKGWVKDPKGNSVGGWGLTLTPVDMARFGLLYLNDGICNNKQIISQKWICESTVLHSEVKFNSTILKYGYLWWLKTDDGVFTYSAIGDGGNIICCIPEKELVIAIAAKWTPKPPRDRWELIKKYILSAIN
ncbi:serine hydrolase domain-containing protein [Clostridium guangxiense]|uniref:serine hydrolase domain-containing protein n=1 Tax=Clostridium guangxiense TaxID=1662055 RepID=UPI001E4F9A66|nr:serine hydrolase [Clostridium guangxiense]MCD2346804.1 beta-lactamase family protein [Clostridium guangxiense]